LLFPCGIVGTAHADGHMLVMIMRKTRETEVLIDWWWHAERYTKNKLLRAFAEAGCATAYSSDFPCVTSG
jgi:hypothetical protein